MSRIAFDLHAGETVHLWLRSATQGEPGRALLDGPVRVEHLDVPPGDDFARTAFEATGTGTVTVEPQDGATVSLAYAFDPADVAQKGIRVLFTTAANRAPSGPRYHFTPPFGWMNDPNGLVGIGREIHLFYQHYPHFHRWNTMHWGHAVSRDGGLSFTHLPIFLEPRPELLASDAESGGAFSGSAIADGEGGLRIFYTDRQDSREPEWEWQMTTVSRDRVFPGPSRPIIDRRPDVPGLGKDFRDPYVFKGPDGLWKLLLGGQDEAGSVVFLYETAQADAASGWRFAGTLFRSSSQGTGAAECPCLVPVGDGLWTLIYCLLFSRDEATGRRNLSHAVTGRFDGRSFEPLHTQEMDFGTDAYAFQATTTPDGTIGIGWAANWIDVDRNADFPSAMTLMRRFEWRGDYLATPPLHAPSALRGDRLAGDLAAGTAIAIPDGTAEIAFTLARPNAPFRLVLDHPTIELALVHDGEALELVHEPAGAEPGPLYRTATPGLHELRVFLDTGLVEIYADDGRWCCTKRLADPAPIRAVRFEAGGEAIASAAIFDIPAGRVDAAPRPSDPT